MSTFVHYTPEQRSIDLAELAERDFILISSMYGQIRRGDRTLLCEQTLTADGDGSEMYVKQRNGRFYAAHFPGSSCTQEHEIVRESDEHRRQKDYWQRAAEFAGYEAVQELRTGNGTTLDVAIEGPRRTGIEVQHSSLRTNLAKSRSTRSFRAGWLPVWFLDSDHTPPWFHAVPAVNCNIRLPWSESLPPRRSATALGPSRFVAVRCTARNVGTCPTGTPKRPRRPCGKHHPHRQPWYGLTVDDVAAMVPGEHIVPMRDLKGNVHLVDHENLRLFQEITGLSGAYHPSGSERRPRQAPTSSHCRSHPDDLSLSGSGPNCSKCDRAPAGPGGVLCLACRMSLETKLANTYNSPRHRASGPPPRNAR